MAIKIEIGEGVHLPAKTQNQIEKILECLPREHLRGVERVKLVTSINDPRIKHLQQRTDLPGLYHPKQGLRLYGERKYGHRKILRLRNKKECRRPL